jgi:hypothetical protein
MQPRHAILMSFVALSACAGGAAPRQELFDPGTPTAEQLQQLQAAERAYRADDPGYPAQRDALARDPVTATWLSRLFVRDLLLLREHPPADEQAVLLAAAGKKNRTEVRAFEQIQALGSAAMPCIVEDLLRHRQGMPRELGVELTGAVGAAALPALQPLLQSGDARQRCTAVRALAALPASPAMLAGLRQAATDADFTVRGAAVRGLEHGDASDGERLRQWLAGDEDPFVRRMAAQALGGHKETASATALIAYLERCLRERDSRGEDAAQASLQLLSGSKGPRTVLLWQRWLAQWQPSSATAGRQEE